MIQPTGLAVLDALDLGKEVRRLGARIDRLFGRAGESGRTVLDVRYAALGRGANYGIGIHRAGLFGLLFDAARAAGISIVTGRAVCKTDLANDRRHLVFDDGERSQPFDLVVNALGTRTPFAPTIGRSLAYGALWASFDWPDGSGFDEAALDRHLGRVECPGAVWRGRPSPCRRHNSGRRGRDGDQRVQSCRSGSRSRGIDPVAGRPADADVARQTLDPSIWLAGPSQARLPSRRPQNNWRSPDRARRRP